MIPTALEPLALLITNATSDALAPKAALAPSSAASILPPPTAIVGPILFLVALCAVALLLARRRRAMPHRVAILETTALGPKRSLVLARLGDEMLLLGSSEAGIALLRSQPYEADPLAARPAGREVKTEENRAEGGLVDLATRLMAGRRRDARPNSPAFEALLAESAEDQELRRKLARGQAGSVR